MCNKLQKEKGKENFQINTEQQYKNSQQEQQRGGDILSSYRNPSNEFLQAEKEMITDKESKWESQSKKQRRAKRKALLEGEEQRKRLFFEPADRMTATMEEKMSALMQKEETESTITEITSEFQKVMEKETSGFEPLNLIKEEERQGQFKSLCELFSMLHNQNPEGFTVAKAKEALEKYRKLNLKVEANAARYLFEKMEEDEEPVGARDPQTCYLLLYNCVTVALRNEVNARDESVVNIDAFAKLCGFAEASTLAASYLCVSDSFMKKHASTVNQIKKEKAEEREKAEQAEKEKLAKKRLSAIARIVSESIEEDIWPKAMVYELVKKYFGDRLYAENFDKEVNFLREKISNGITDARNLLENNKNLYQDMKLLKEKAAQILLQKLDTDFLGEMTEEKKKMILEEMTKDSEIQRWEKRKKGFRDILRDAKVEFKESDLTELWESKQMQLLIMNEKDDSVYEKICKELAEQAKLNLETIELLVNKNFFNLNRPRAVKKIRKQLGGSWITGSSNIVYSQVWDFIDNMNLKDTKLHHRESDFRKAVRELKLEGFEEAAGNYLQEQSGSELFRLDDWEEDEEILKENEKKRANEWKDYTAEKMKEKLGRCPELMEKNQKAFQEQIQEKKYGSKAWDGIEEWYKKNIFLAEKRFKEQLSQYLEQLDSQKAEKELFSREEYSKKGNNLEIQTENYRKKIREEFCKCQEFGSKLDGMEMDIEAAMEKILENKELIKHMPFLEQVDSLDNLDNLTHIEFNNLMKFFRSNMRNCVDKWSTLQCLYEKEVKAELLSDILAGNLNEKTLLERAEEINEQKVKQHDMDTLRFYVALEVGKESTNTIEYQVIKAETEKKGLIWKKNDQISKDRIKRFAYVKKAWDLIRARNLDTKLLLICKLFTQEFARKWETAEKKMQKATEQKKREAKAKLYDEETKKFAIDISLGKTSKWLSMTEGFDGPDGFLEEDKEELKNIFGLIKDETKKTNQDYIKEFLLCGAESMVFGYGKKNEDVFLNKNKELYTETLNEASFNIIKRNHDLSSMLRGLEKSTKDSEHMKIRLLELMAGLEEVKGTEAEKRKIIERNRERFGIESWEEAAKAIMLLYDDKKVNGEKSKYFEESQKMGEAAALYKKRKTDLEDYEGGMFKAILPFLLEKPRYWREIMSGSEEQFEQYKAELKKSKIGKISDILSKNVALPMQSQFIMYYDKAIFNDSDETSQEEWIKRVDDFCENAVDKLFRVGDKSLFKHLGELRERAGESEDVFKKNILVIIKNNPDSYYALLDEEEFSNLIKNYYTQKGKNEETLRKSDFYGDLSQEEQKKLEEKLSEKMLLLRENDFERLYYSKFLPEFMREVQIQKVEEANDILNNKAEIIEEIEKHKAEGEEADRKDIETLRKIRKELWQAGSPLMAHHGKLDRIKQSEFEKAKKYVEDRFAEMPPVVKKCLIEQRILKDKPLSDELVEELSTAYEKLKQKKLGQENLTGKEIRAHLVFWSIQKGNTDETFEKLEIRKTMLKTVQNLTTENAAIRAELKDFKECAAMAVYTMEQEEFEKLITRRMKYFESLEAAYRVFDSKLKEKQIREEDMEKCKAALGAFFRKEIVENEPLKMSFGLKVEKWLSDEVKWKYLQESAQQQEQDSSPVLVGLKDLEQFLVQTKDKDVLKRYNKLENDERKIFALALMIPGKASVNDILPNADLMDTEIQNAVQVNEEIQEQLRAYIEGREFAPEINYAKVLEKVRNEEGELNKDNFDMAMSFTELCMNQYEENLPKDWERLGNGISSICAAEEIKGIRASEEKYKVPETVRSIESFKEKFNQFANEDSNRDSSVIEIRKKIEEIFKVKKGYMLISVLQNRTMLDYTTGTSFIDRANGSVHEFANEEMYQNAKEFWGSRTKAEEEVMGNRANTTKFCTQAMQTLFSYQLRDDVSFVGRRIEESDFAKDALKRKTLLDWKLLERAIDFISEADTEYLRIQACRNAKEYIKYSGNEAAKKQSKEYGDKFKNIKEKQGKNLFEKFLSDNVDAGNDEESVLLAGYLDLDEREKALFVKALQNRDILDVSKRGLWMNQFGLKEREYVNEKGRNQMITEYIRDTLSERGQVVVEERSYGEAVQSLLSTQIDDSIDFAKYKNVKAEKLMAKEHFYQADRNTAIDWKLFRRALQFVHRATNERRMFEQDKEVYLAGVSAEEAEKFQFDSAFLRRNIHRSGNVVTRFLGKRLLSHILDKFPVKYQRMALLVLPVKTANYINSIEGLQREGTLSDAIEEFYSDMKEVIEDSLKEKEEEKEEEQKEEEEEKEEKEEEQKEEEKEENDGDDEEDDEDEDEDDGEEEMIKPVKNIVDSLKERENRKNPTEDPLGYEVEDAESDEEEQKEEIQDTTRIMLGEVKRKMNKIEDDTEIIKKQLLDKVEEVNNGLGKVLEEGSDLLKKGLFTKTAETCFSEIYDIDIEDTQLSEVTGILDQWASENVYSKVKDALIGEEKYEEYKEALSGFSESVGEIQEAIGDAVDYANKAKEVIDNVIECGRTLVGKIEDKKSLDEADKKAEEASAEDTEMLEKTKLNRTERQQRILEEARKRQNREGKIASDTRKEHINTEMFETVSSVITDTVGEVLDDATDLPISTIMKEVQEFVVFIRCMMIDNDLLKQYYEKSDEEVRRIKERLNSVGKYRETSFFNYSNMQVIQKAKGFENITELAAYAGMNIVQSLLFSASKENSLKETKIRAVAILATLGMKDAIGKRDSKTALKVFKKLMKDEYR